MNLLRALMFTTAMLIGAVSAHAQTVSGQGNWQDTLQARDVGNTGTTNAFYDITLNITWLVNANINGAMNWTDAMSWANNLSVGDVSGWRLPMGDTCHLGPCTSNEMSHLWYVALGNAEGGPMTNKGAFQNIQLGYYWTNMLISAGWASEVNFDSGDVGHLPLTSSPVYAMAVHDGDVAPIPEPETYAMLLAGLGLIGTVARRRRSDSASRQTLMGTSISSVSAVGHSG